LRTTLALSKPALPREVRDAYLAPYRGRARRRGIDQFVADIPAAADHPSRATLERVAEGITELDVPTLFAWGPRHHLLRPLPARPDPACPACGRAPFRGGLPPGVGGRRRRLPGRRLAAAHVRHR